MSSAYSPAGSSESGLCVSLSAHCSCVWGSCPVLCSLYIAVVCVGGGGALLSVQGRGALLSVQGRGALLSVQGRGALLCLCRVWGVPLSVQVLLSMEGTMGVWALLSV